MNYSNIMGRQQFTRLALGRSPFQELKDDEQDRPDLVAETNDAAQSMTQELNGDYVQQYDTKGRPVNQTTQARNAEMRRAQNSVLALVGVVESRELSEHHHEMKLRYIREARHALLKEEQDRGEAIDSIATILLPLLTWWPHGVLRRFLIGFYDAKVPFAEALVDEWHNLLSGGLKGAYAALLPGAGAYLMYLVARTCVDLAIAEPVNRMLDFIANKPIKRKTRRRLDTATRYIAAALIVATDLPILPLCYYATAQQLGLAPTWPLLPSMKSLLPWHPTSFHFFGWTPMIGIPVLRAFSSPAVLLLAQLALTSNTDTEGSYLADFTTFRYPRIDQTSNWVARPALLQDPLGRLLYHTYKLRENCLGWCGWSVRPSTIIDHQHHGLERAMVLSGEENGSTVKCVQRSTSMAHLPAQYLATRIDWLLDSLMLLPLEGLMLRAVALSYLSSPLPKTLTALKSGHSLYAPFGGGVLNWIRSPSSATELAYYASKIGLCLALGVSIDAALCLGVSKIVRWHGKRSFDWGSRSRMGGIVY